MTKTNASAGIGPLTKQLSDLEQMIQVCDQANEVAIMVTLRTGDPEKDRRFVVNFKDAGTLTGIGAMNAVIEQARQNLKSQQRTIRAAIKKAGITPAKKPAAKKAAAPKPKRGAKP